MHHQSYASLVASKAPKIEQKCKKTTNAQKTVMVVFSHANTLENISSSKRVSSIAKSATFELYFNDLSLIHI